MLKKMLKNKSAKSKAAAKSKPAPSVGGGREGQSGRGRAKVSLTEVEAASDDSGSAESRSNSSNEEISLDMQLIHAATSADPQAVKELLELGASAKFLYKGPSVWGSADDYTALTKAVNHFPAGKQKYKDWLSILKMLLEAGADPNAKEESYDWRGCGSSSSAFEGALRSRDRRVIDLFLKHGADPNQAQERNTHSMRTDGFTKWRPLHDAVRMFNPAALLEAGADVNAEFVEEYHNERGYDREKRMTALHIACEAFIKMSKTDRDSESDQEDAHPSDEECDVTDGDHHYSSPTRTGMLNTISLLIEHGADVNAVMKQLHLEEIGGIDNTATCNDDPRDEHWQNPYRRVMEYQTALHMALKAGAADLALILVASGADASIVYKYGEEETTPQELCKGDQELVKSLEAEWTPENHKYFPKKFQSAVKEVLLTSKRQDWVLCSDVMELVFKSAAKANVA